MSKIPIVKTDFHAIIYIIDSDQKHPLYSAVFAIIIHDVFQKWSSAIDWAKQ